MVIVLVHVILFYFLHSCWLGSTCEPPWLSLSWHGWVSLLAGGLTWMLGPPLITGTGGVLIIGIDTVLKVRPRAMHIKGVCVLFQVSENHPRRFLSVVYCINRGKGYLLPTWVWKITCRGFDWMLQSSSGWKHPDDDWSIQLKHQQVIFQGH